MVHRIILTKLKPECSSQKVEEMMIETRIRLLKIPEVMNLLCGKKIHTDAMEYDFFIAMDFENMAKASVMEDSAVYLQFKHQVLEPNAAEKLQLDFEMEPGKNTAFS
jgi:hypothetical protein